MLNAIKNLFLTVLCCLACFVVGANYGAAAEREERETYNQIMDEMKENIINTTFHLPWK